MHERERALVRVAAAMGAGDFDALAATLRAAHAAAGARAIEEVLLQGYLFVGYPRTLRALALWRKQSGIAAPSFASHDADVWEARGEQVCRTVYGAQYARLRANVAALHPDLERWMLHEGYGKVLGRPGLELAVRELCVVAILALQDAPAQLYSHLRGALNAGAVERDVTEALEIALSAATAERGAAAMEVWAQVRDRRAPADADEEDPGPGGGVDVR